jgi:hypothetical protein
MMVDLKQVLHELRSGQNIDVYLTIVVCAALLTFDIFGVTNASAISSGILAVLLLLALNNLQSRHTHKRLEHLVTAVSSSQASPSVSAVFREWNDNLFKERITTARHLKLLSIANIDFLLSNTEVLKDFLRRDGTIRSIYVKPDGEAIKVVAAGGAGVDKHPKYIAERIWQSFLKLQEFAEVSKNPDSIQVKIVDQYPNAILTMIDYQDVNKIMFVTLNAFREPYANRPSFVLKNQDQKWFTFYENCFEHLWSCEDAQEVNLAEVSKLYHTREITATEPPQTADPVDRTADAPPVRP